MGGAEEAVRSLSDWGEETEYYRRIVPAGGLLGDQCRFDCSK